MAYRRQQCPSISAAGSSILAQWSFIRWLLYVSNFLERRQLLRQQDCCLSIGLHDIARQEFLLSILTVVVFILAMHCDIQYHNTAAVRFSLCDVSPRKLPTRCVTWTYSCDNCYSSYKLWLKSESISRNKATLHAAWRKEKFRIVFYWRPHLPSSLHCLQESETAVDLPSVLETANVMSGLCLNKWHRSLL